MDVKTGRSRPISAEPRAAADARKTALDCMLSALEHLDGDASISPIIGSQLQLAIDRLISSMPDDPQAIHYAWKSGQYRQQ